MSELNLNQPRWDQSTYIGRAKHFFAVTNPLNVLCSSQRLAWAESVVKNAKVRNSLSEEEIWRAKYIYDSAFHPDTGDKMFLLGRMSAQVPMNMTITGCMLTFYKTTPQVIFWQWFNQSFNAIVNYTNRSGKSQISNNTLITSYCAATGGALATALSLNAMVKTLPPLIGRLVPFAACSAANSINIPMMRRTELSDGVTLYTKEGEAIGESKTAAKEGITKVVLSRIGMGAPGMIFIPMIMNVLERRGVLARYPRISAPLQTILCGVSLTFATPLCCALFEQKAAISVDRIENHLKERLKNSDIKYLYYNKGL